MRLSRWDAYSLILIIIFSALILLNHFEFPLSLDIYYHLGVAQEFNRTGGFSIINFSEFAPMGRVQLYPPLFQIITALLLKTGINPMLLAKLLNMLIFPIFLFVFWRILRNLIGEKESFFSVLLLSSPYSLFVICVDNIPATICLMLILGSLYKFEKKRPLGASILLGLAFYSHLAFALMGAIVILLYGLFKRADFKTLFGIIIGAVAISSIYLIHVTVNSKLLSMGSQRDPLEITWLIYLLATLSIYSIIKEKQFQKYLFWIVYAAASLIILFTYPFRFFSGQGIIPFAILASITLSKSFDFLEKKSKNIFPHFAIKLFIFFILLNFIWPLFVIDKHVSKKNFSVFGDTTFRQLTHSIKEQPFRLHDVSLNSKFAGEITQIIKENTEENDIFFSNMGIFGQLLSVTSNRANASGMLSEVNPRFEPNPLLVSKLFVALKKQDCSKDFKADRLAKQAGFRDLAETEIAVIYKNDALKPTRSENSAGIKFIFIFIFLVILIALATCEEKIFKH